MTRFDVWVPERNKARVLAALEALSNLPALEPLGGLDGDVLELPVTVNDPVSGPLLTGDQRPGGPSLIGWSTGYDVFGQPGWTPERFAQFVTTRSRLYPGIGAGPRPTVAALAGYLQSPLLVDEEAGDRGRSVSFITTEGNVTIAEYAHGEADAAEVRDTFFNEGPDRALALSGLTLRKAGLVDPFSLRDEALNRRMDLASWKGSDESGKVVVPKGAKLIPLNMVIVDHDGIDSRRPVIGHVRSSKHLYEIIVPVLDELGPLDVTCAVDGVLQRFIDPVTGEDKGLGAHAADWANWILRHSVPDGHEGPPPAGQPWEGNSPDARLYRLAHNIVNYEDHDTDTTYFSTAGDVEAWLRRALGNHNAPLTVRVLDDVSFTLDAKGPALIQTHIYDRSDGNITGAYRTAAFQPWAGRSNWWNPERLAYTRNPSLNTVMDGQTLQAYKADNCLDYNDLEPYLLPVDARANEGSWFVVQLGDT
ncbi:hypothetical protein, partial [Arthrobacter sp.]|uniref:hypothetical protein n=1 Tax=Arthrobacter sp. TaxID=1667 RepID=UPI003397E316